MDEDKLLPHVENLVPGYVTLLLLATSGPQSVRDLVVRANALTFLQQPVTAALAITATAYLVGVVVFIASRLLVDTASKWSFRWILLMAFDWNISLKGDNGPELPKWLRRPRWLRWPRQFTWLRESLRVPWVVNQRYYEKVKEALDESSMPLARREVIKRRERGRLIRTALVPGALIGNNIWDETGVLVAFAVVVFLYAHAEVAIYREALLALPAKGRSESAVPKQPQ